MTPYPVDLVRDQARLQHTDCTEGAVRDPLPQQRGAMHRRLTLGVACVALLALGVLAARHPPAFVTLQGGYAATLTCLATTLPCRQDSSAQHRRMLNQRIARAIEGRIDWRNFQVEVNIVNHASDGTYTAVGWIAAPPVDSLIWRGRERFSAQLDRDCPEPRCWIVRSITLNGRTIGIAAAN